MRNRLRSWWMRRRRLVCQDAGRESEVEIEHAVLYVSPDGQAYRVRRLACTCCGRRCMTAQRQTWHTPEPEGAAAHVVPRP